VTPLPPVMVFVSVANDVSLSQNQWIQLHDQLEEELIRGGGRIIGDFASAPTARWQGFLWCIELPAGIVDRMQEVLSEVARAYGPPSLAWAEAPKTIRLG
jgi:hypothetical protein